MAKDQETEPNTVLLLLSLPMRTRKTSAGGTARLMVIQHLPNCYRWGAPKFEMGTMDGYQSGAVDNGGAPIRLPNAFSQSPPSEPGNSGVPFIQV